ncbi:MAG TPA: DUF308 domain-containing protein, partial [Candidatus Limnocylindria bacterium]|nr:DUF308 domain-containing protein [Candidatus Limnocylindria bacterium]
MSGFGMQATIGLARWWWTFILRGAVAILFGVLSFLAPGVGIGLLVGLFAAWALIDGINGLLTGIRTRNQDRSWWLEILEGVVGLVAGVIALLLPAFAAEILILLIGAWAIVTGIVEIVLAYRLRRVISGEAWMALAGVASILFGVVIFLFPAAGALSIVWLLGSFAIAFGVFLVMLGWRLRGVDRMARRDAA